MCSDRGRSESSNHHSGKILYVTATLPYGPGESFLIPEVKELLRKGYDLRIVPRSPSFQLIHQDAAGLEAHCLARSLYSWEVLGGALAEICLRPRNAFRALGVLFRGSGWGDLVKNLVVFPKGLWLGRVARAWGADHIHAHWISTPATIGLVASIVSQTPWSCTAHRADIDLDNLLAEKLRQATLVRFISHSGWRMSTSLGAARSAKRRRHAPGRQYPIRRRDADDARTPGYYSLPVQFVPRQGASISH